MNARVRGCLALLLAASVVSGCAGGPPPVSTSVPASSANAREQVGAADTIGAAPGSANAKFRYRFRQTQPSSSGFTFYDRDLSFYFRPAPDALHFQVENKQDRSVWIDWDRTQFISPVGSTSGTAHATSTFKTRYGTQAQTQIRGLQRYSDYVLPLDYLLDTGTDENQVHRPLLPEDDAAQGFSGREFGVDLVFIVDNQPRTYSFRFQVVSVLPN
jgi:hypothetical protein